MAKFMEKGILMKNFVENIRGLLDDHPVMLMVIAAVVGFALFVGVPEGDITELVGKTSAAVAAVLSVVNLIRSKAKKKTAVPSGDNTGGDNDGETSESESGHIETGETETGSGSGGLSSGSGGY